MNEDHTDIIRVVVALVLFVVLVLSIGTAVTGCTVCSPYCQYDPKCCVVPAACWPDAPDAGP